MGRHTKTQALLANCRLGGIIVQAKRDHAMDTVDLFLKYVVVPVGAFVWMIHNKINSHHTEIEVLKAQVEATKIAHDREFKEVRDNFKRVFEKLDGIEEALRK
jgi:hypothetical protein